MSSEEETRQVVGKQGNVYEDNPAATRRPPLAMRLRLERQRRRGGEPRGAEQAEKAQKAIEAGVPQAPDHGAPVGAKNVLKFHQWKKDGGEG